MENDKEPRHRVPFPKNQQRSPPTKLNSVEKTLDPYVNLESLLDLSLEKKILREIHKDGQKIQDIPISSTDASLLSSMTKRLMSLEQQMKVLQQAILEKDRIITDLQRHDQEAIRKENQQLKKQLTEMETFLNDYGLSWVGHPVSDEEPGLTIQQSNTDHFQLDMVKLRHCIKELNIAAGEGQSTIVTQTDTLGTKRLKIIDPITLAVYRNGFIFGSPGPFRSFVNETSKTFLNDILDGFFPHELKERYPDGVPFALLDKYDEVYHAPPSGHIASLTEAHPEVLDRQKFLAKLPKSVISNGRIIEIRSGIADILNGHPSDNNTIKDQDTISLKTHVMDTDNSDITTIKIKTEQGTKYIVRLKFDDTFKTLRSYLDTALKKDNKTFEYELRTSFPSKVYSYLNQTFRSAGLIPNAALFVKKVSSNG